MRKIIWIAIIAFFLCSSVSAEFYRYLDKKGRVRYTDDINRVPAGQQPDVLTKDGKLKAPRRLDEQQRTEPGVTQPDTSILTAPETSEENARIGTAQDKVDDSSEGQRSQTIQEKTPEPPEDKVLQAPVVEKQKPEIEAKASPPAAQPVETIQTPEIDLKEMKKRLEQKKQALNNELQALMDEKEGLDQIRDSVKTQEEVQQYNERIQQLNQKIGDYKKKQGDYNTEVNAYNSLLEEKYKKND
jgi:FtsZ-binding cell division protein ZapB